MSWLTRLPSPRVAAALLAVLCLACYLPGLLRLPAVDRTEIIFAETTRQMVARGAWLDPRYGSTVHQFHPIGTYWLQGAAAVAAGGAAERNISVYRLPSLLGVGLAIVALFWLAYPIVGVAKALVAAALFAVAPLTVLTAQLAIADGIALAAATIAMMSLLRLYVAEATMPTRGLALAFWTATGAGMLVNALQTPILVVVTLIALVGLDRDLGWLRRTNPLMGLLVALLVAAPWLAVRALQDGVPYAGLSTPEFVNALGGAQDMRLRAWTGTFLLAAFAGFLPGTALLPDALKRLWDERSARVMRFLLAWIAGYLVYLELFSAKPATYSVQLIYPALALAVARIVMAQAEGREAPRWSLVPRPFFGALLPAGLFAAVYAVLREPPTLPAVLFIAVVTGLSAYAGHVRDLRQWAGLAVTTFALFAVTLIAVVAPSLRTLWPSRAIAEASRRCSGDVTIYGFPEPSTAFVLGERWKPITFELTPEVKGRLHVVESRWLEAYGTAMAERGATPVELGCLEAYNPMRGCPMTFTFTTLDRAAAKCAGRLGAACERVKKQRRPTFPDCG